MGKPTAASAATVGFSRDVSYGYYEIYMLIIATS